MGDQHHQRQLERYSRGVGPIRVAHFSRRKPPTPTTQNKHRETRRNHNRKIPKQSDQWKNDKKYIKQYEPIESCLRKQYHSNNQLEYRTEEKDNDEQTEPPLL